MATLVDAGPIVALFDADEPYHSQCVAMLETVSGPLVTCEAVLAEACYLLRNLGDASRQLLLDVRDGRYVVDYALAKRAGEIAKLLGKYADVPMSLADACLVDLAEIHQTARVLTLDTDFRIYRWARNRPFELVIAL
jgi:predicted nucleic acid-binding protein